jgi:hypothetical protein
MFAAAEELRFEYAAKLRDEIKDLRRELVAATAQAGLLELTPSSFDPQVNLGLQRKRNRYARMRAKYSGRVPTPPSDHELDLVGLADAQVIERMSPRKEVDGRPCL